MAASLVFIGSTALASLASLSNGTGSSLDLSQVDRWLPIESSKPINALIVGGIADHDESATDLDIRTASQHMVNIRSVLNPAISDLAAIFDVSRQAIYKWIRGESDPEMGNLARIQKLSRVADRFADAGIQRASALLKMKAFDGRSLLDLIAADQLAPEHLELLVSEAQAMQNAYKHSRLAQSKAAPTDDWQSSHSIPGTVES